MGEGAGAAGGHLHRHFRRLHLRRGPRQSPRTAPPGSVILCMLPDTGERYMTTPLFDGIEAEMDADEIALSRSTPGFQFPARDLTR